jgi:hypothetical protein
MNSEFISHWTPAFFTPSAQEAKQEVPEPVFAGVTGQRRQKYILVIPAKAGIQQHRS